MAAKKRGPFFTVFTFARISLRRYFRDRTAIFYTIAFPLIFLLIFGGIFGKQNDISFNVGLINQSNSQFSKDFIDQIAKKPKMFKVNQNIHTLSDAKLKMSRGEVDATIVLPADFGTVKNGKYPSGQV